MTGARYRQIAADLRERIALGDVGVGGALESESSLGVRYDASRITVRKALELLRDDGLIASRPGAGWFVTSSSFQQPLALGTFRHAASAVTESGSHLDRTVASFTFTELPSHLSDVLTRPTGTPVLQVRSVRATGGEPLDRVTEWVPGELAEQLPRAAAVSPGIWQSLQRQGQTIASVRQSITAGVAGDLDTELLNVSVGSPLLLIRRVALDGDGTPLALSDHRYLAHRFSLEVEFHGWAEAQTDIPPGLRQEPA